MGARGPPAWLRPARGGGADADPRRPGWGQGPPQAVPHGRHAPLTTTRWRHGIGRVAATTAGPRPGAGARTRRRRRRRGRSLARGGCPPRRSGLGCVGGPGSSAVKVAARRRQYASGWSWRSSCIRLQTSVPSAQMYGSTLAASSRAVARSTPSSSAHRSNGAAIGRPKSASCQVPTAVGYPNTCSRSEARGPPPVTPMRPGYLHLGTRRNDPTAHSPTVSAADIPTSPGCAPGSEPTHRRSELRSRRTCWPQYRSNALGEQRVEPGGDPAGVC
jgi:hypothetical protein